MTVLKFRDIKKCLESYTAGQFCITTDQWTTTNTSYIAQAEHMDRKAGRLHRVPCSFSILCNHACAGHSWIHGGMFSGKPIHHFLSSLSIGT